MMHGFVFPFGFFWIVIPAIAIWLAIPAIRRLRRSDERTIDTGRGGKPLEANLEPAVYRLAKQLKGRVTVSDVVVETGLSAAESETLLQGLVDGTHCRMEVTEQGSVIYEFPELTPPDSHTGSGQS